MGATVVGVGPGTNLALLEVARPKLLASTRLVVLGGYVRWVGAGLPRWEAEMDSDVQQDELAARMKFLFGCMGHIYDASERFLRRPGATVVFSGACCEHLGSV